MLSIAAMSGGASHLIPLYVLQRRYFQRIPSLRNYFLLPETNHKRFQRQGLRVLPLDYNLQVRSIQRDLNQYANQLMQIEYRAVRKVKPQIILEDNAFGTPLIAEKNQIPRISIHRTGFFRSIPATMRHPHHVHSLEKGFEKKKYFDASPLLRGKAKDLSIQRNQTMIGYLSNYLNAKSKLIPGISSIEVLPNDIENRSSYFYTGPLIVEDNPSAALVKEINAFLEYHKNRPKAFITLGLIDQSNIKPFIKHLLMKGYAVISTSKLVAPSPFKQQYFYNGFLPLHFICSKVDLIIHQCGSGIYHYPILNDKPVITIGTQCYDREDVALRLQQLGVSKHVPHQNDDADYLNIFKTQIEAFEKKEICDFRVLKMLKEEIHQTLLKFDMEEVLSWTLEKK